MKKANKFFVYALCILLAAVIACGSLMVGAADATVSDSASYSNRTGEDLSYREETIPTEKDITDTIDEIIKENELDKPLSEFGQDVSEFSGEAESFLSELIAKIQAAVERLTEFLKQIFRVGVFD